MNKQELIKKYKELENGTFDIGALVVCQSILKDLEQLDEPEKVTVPQFVADWYEKHKYDLEYNIWKYIFNWEKQEKSEFHKWMNQANNKPLQTIVNMHQFGYEVEEEPKYIVKMKGISSLFRHLKYNLLTEKWYMGNDTENEEVKKTHTRKEIEDAGFGEVFNSPLFEIEEVEE
jgi:hypothetical protein